MSKLTLVSRSSCLVSRKKPGDGVCSDEIRGTRYEIRIGLLLCTLLLSACGYFESKKPTLAEPIDRIAVLPLRRAQVSDPSQILPGAERTITAQIYGVLASAPQWNYVPDLLVMQVLSRLPREDDVVAQAAALGKVIKTDAVLCGTVSKYTEREGSEYGARQPAAVGFDLQLVSAKTGKVLWQGSFDQKQKALSENLFNWWQFWKGGVRWFSADEFSRIGVERLLEDLKRQYQG